MHRHVLAIALMIIGVSPAAAQDGSGARDADRGPGVPSSMFGTYIGAGELLVYPFFEYYRDRNFEYKPEELGHPGGEDFRGHYRAREALLFFGYGLTGDLAVEFEMAAIDATLTKSPDDPSALPARLTESGLGDIEAQLRWRWRRETESRPEFFSYGEVVFPHAKAKPLIGTADYELKFGTGLVRGTRFGTWTARAALEYAAGSSSQLDLGEYAVEYLKRLSPSWRVYAGIEGTQDEVSAIGEIQWHLNRYAFVRVNSGFGLTSKATDWAPEVGIVFTIPTR
jgi:hypothetical protein